jgi:hypothetical protein
MIPSDPQPAPELAATGSPITPAALRRLSGEAASQRESSAVGLANAGQSNPTAQDLHPSAQRLASSQLDGKTGQLNHAQAAQPGSEVWVTVPVDKVTTSEGTASITPVYASTQGYVPRPGESRGSVPPGHRVGRPY